MCISFCCSSETIERGSATLYWYVPAKPPVRRGGDESKCSRDTPRLGDSSWEPSLTTGLAVFLLGDPCESPWFAVVRCWQVMVLLRWVRWVAWLISVGSMMVLEGILYLALPCNATWIEFDFDPSVGPSHNLIVLVFTRSAYIF